MRLATIQLHGKELAAIVGAKGVLPIAALNAAKGTAWKEELYPLIRAQQVPGLTNWYREGGQEELERGPAHPGQEPGCEKGGADPAEAAGPRRALPGEALPQGGGQLPLTGSGSFPGQGQCLGKALALLLQSVHCSLGGIQIREGKPAAQRLDLSGHLLLTASGACQLLPHLGSGLLKRL